MPLTMKKPMKMNFHLFVIYFLIDELSLLKKTIDEIGEYSLFQFRMQIEKCFALSTYEIHRPMEAWVEIKGDGVSHFLFHSDRNRGRYDDILIERKKYVASNDVFKVSSS